MSYIKKNIAYYRTKFGNRPDNELSVTDRTILEHSLQDVAAFYFGAFEMNLSTYTTANVLETFKRLETAKYLGSMYLYYAKLLRSHKYDEDLIFLKNKLIHEEPQRGETLSVVQVTLEYYYNNKNYPYDRWR